LKRAQATRSLLLEDDPVLVSGLCAYLRADGNAMDWWQRLAQASALRNETCDALLVDWQLPDGSGLDSVHALRAMATRRPWWR